MQEGEFIGWAWMAVVVGGPIVLAAAFGYGILRSRSRRRHNRSGVTDNG